MSPQSFSLKYALRNVWRRKVRNVYAILGIALGVSLLLGVQVSMASSAAGWETMFLRGLGDAEAELIPIRVPYINESTATDLKQVVATIDSIDAIAGRLILSTTAFEPDSGRLELGVPLVGVSEDEEGFGSYRDTDGKEITLSENTTAQLAYISDTTSGYNGTVEVNSRLLIGKDLAEDLGISKNQELFIVFAAGSFKFNLTKSVDDIYKDENRGREYNSHAMVMRLNVVQSIVANHAGTPQAINNIRVNFADSVDTKEEGEDALDELRTATNSLSGVPEFYSTYFFYANTKYYILDFVQVLSDALTQMLQIFGTLIVLSGILLIVNIQLMSIEEREQQIGVLRAIGTQRPQILTTTVIETVLLGFIGSALGIIGGIIYGRVLTEAMAWTFGYPASEIPIFPPNMMEIALMSFLIGFALALFTSLAPAWRASRINIVEVIRGITPPQEKSFGKKGFYLGMFLVVLGLILLAASGLQPWEEKAWVNINDAEILFFIILLPVIGLSLCGSYFFSKRWSLNIMAFALVGWPFITGIYIVNELVKEGTGGIYLILGMLLALAIGSCILIGVNLKYVALFVRKTIGALPGMKAISLISMEQMASKKTRSTLVFAIFSVILTMNIFLASWSYSFRYGADETVELQAGGVDIIIVADQDIPSTFGFPDLIQTHFEDQGADLVQGFSLSSEATPLFTDKEDVADLNNLEYGNAVYQHIIPLNQSSFWGDSFDFEGWTFQFELEGTKIDELETFSGWDLAAKGAREENERTWAAVANNQYSSATGLPLAIIRYIGEGFAGPAVVEGESIWLLHQDGTPIEFTVATLHGGNVLSDWPTAYDLPDLGGIFISQEQAVNLQAFDDGLDSHSLFLIRADDHKIRSDENDDLATSIEEWANGNPSGSNVGIGEKGWFRQNHGIYGIAAFPAWDIYEIQLDGMFRIMTFMQIFTSGGFLVGVLGLLVVAMRSVQERKREIGMMRSLGFRKLDITFAVLMELVLMGLIGLFVGLVDGIFMGYVLISLNSGMAFLIPWPTIAFYAVVILSSAFFAAIIPGWLASRIPPSDALRYAG